MARFIKKHKKEIGISPDELWFRGEQKIENVLMRIIDFDSTNLEEKSLSSVNELVKFRDKNSVSWFNVDGLHNIGIMEEISTILSLEKIILADVMNPHSNPKVQEYDNCLFISIKMMQHDEKTDRISVENLSLILTKSVLISFQEKQGDVFEPIRERIRKQKKRIRNSGTDYLTFALLDVVVDNYIYVIGNLGEKIENLEENLEGEPNQIVIDQINTFKRELNYIRKNIKPARELLLAISKMDTEFISDSVDFHYKELLDNINHAYELSESYREILTDQLNIYHTTMTSKLNDIMKFLTIFSVIFIPLTFIAGVYGTNFDVLPELHYKNSYFIMWGIMLTIAFGMLFYFRKRKWF
ncbi:MAG: magnesium/cobalt transporter CorA [Bacteroidetes bacterium]|nr:magnesium/cobalt transporter CorA [Bacteroidota bacterium]MBU1115931.1 magnesium/cobalt transporter CorA [Bacteroidota bacterium]MBU1798472.1 magnesium/cobalt transporter CorA [Bacteroidota bacterium]